MSDFEQSVFNVVQRHPVWGLGMIAYILGRPQAEIRGVVEDLNQRGILPGDSLSLS